MTHVLFVAPQSDLQLSREILRAAQGIQLSVCDGMVDREKLEQYLRSTQYDIVHFAGHGGQSVLMLSDGVLEVGDLLIMLEHQTRLQCVVITACTSTRVATEIHNRMHVPAVACQIDIGDEAAITFTERFYRAYGGTRDVQRAVEVGRATLAKDHPQYADAVFVVNGDMMTDTESAELIAYVRSEMQSMSNRLEAIDKAVAELKENQGRRLMIMMGLLFLAELGAPFLMRWLM